jgi:hypothetical protein
MKLFRRTRLGPSVPPIGAELSFRPEPHVAAAREGGRTVLLDYRDGEYYGLDEVGSRVWDLVAEGRPVGGVVDALEAEYDAPREVLQGDVAALLARLEQLKLVARA